MMKVFRSIRRKLVFSGKFKSYLLYALGEIMLIVFGILIALQINDLNEVRKNRIVEVKIYESLYLELRTNLSILDSAISRYDNNELALQTSLNYVGLLPEKFTQEAKDLIVQTKFSKTNLRDDALSSINNTNKFEFIENESLKELISVYPSEINIFNSQELKIKNIVENRLQPVIEQYVSLIDILPKENTKYEQIRSHGQKTNYADLLNNREYQNSVIDRLVQTQVQLKNAKSLRKKTSQLAIRLKEELKG